MASPAEWLRQLKHEWIIPEIHPERCVHSHCEISDCDHCVDSCPQDAWQLDDDKLAIDTGRCDGCGLCVAACPESALEVPLSAGGTEYQQQKTLLFACEAAATGADTGVVPCLHAITQHTLLNYYQAGYRQIISTRGDCSRCSRHTRQSDHDPDPFRRRLQQLNQLLLSRSATTLRHAQVSSTQWAACLPQKPAADNKAISQRRYFLKNAAIRAVEYSLGESTNPHTSGPWAKKLPPPPEQLQHKQQPAQQLLYPYVPEFDPEHCNGCDACIRLCPHQAITFSDNGLGNSSTSADTTYEPDHHDSPDSVTESEPAYQITPENCTSCHICVEACDQQPKAIRIKNMSALSTHRITLLSANCIRCGNPFHYPLDNTRQTKQLCPICAITRQRQRLFQVD